MILIKKLIFRYNKNFVKRNHFNTYKDINILYYINDGLIVGDVNKNSDYKLHLSILLLTLTLIFVIFN